MSSFFAPRTEIVEKLKEITAFKQIYTPFNTAQITEQSQVTPSAHVNFANLSDVQTAGRGIAVAVKQRYAVTVACRNARSQLDAVPVTDEGGELLMQVIQLLSGWQPPSSTQPLELIAVKDDYSPTACYFTAVFEAKRNMK